MSWFYCYECEERFLEDDAKYRLAEEEDCKPRGTMVMCCPRCKSGEITEVGTCKICGKPLSPDDDDFCEACTEAMDKSIDRLICKIQGDWMKAKDVFVDYLERRWL